MTPAARVIRFVLEVADRESPQRRAAIYRDIAQLVPDENSARELVALADELTLIEKRVLQLRLDLGDESDGGAPKS